MADLVGGVGQSGGMLTDELTDRSIEIGALLRERGETVAVAEGSAGGLVSASLLSIAGASAYYRGGAVIYTADAVREWMAGPVPMPEGMRGATEAFARWLAESSAARLGTTWGVAEAGAAGPPNPYGDPAGHCWVAVSGPVTSAQHVLTGLDDRAENMHAFASAALDQLLAALRAA